MSNSSAVGESRYSSIESGDEGAGENTFGGIPKGMGDRLFKVAPPGGHRLLQVERQNLRKTACSQDTLA
ncbi:13416_t:CDS:2 [Cetraspora pellucida]|uniref:13416_t:CDS:1 n=1 Tax=Cetraspora pellucida TaxID=1433469 RepID=A0A9N9J481_9GLOM|nr:13416_t:CDS:2 [Cetraspora pellucida]